MGLASGGKAAFSPTELPIKIPDGSKFSVSPKTEQFDWIGKGPNGFPVGWIGIFEVGGRELKLCCRYNKDGTAKRQKDFTTDDSEKPNATVFYTLKKQD